MTVKTVPRHRLTARAQLGRYRLGVLLVLAGVLAMHALGGGSHMTMTSAPETGGRLTHAVAAGERAATDEMAMPGLPRAATGTAGWTGNVPAPLAASAAPAVALDPGVEAGCVAVLLGLVLLAARAAVGLSLPARPPAAASGGHSSGPLGRGPPKRLLAQICVLRT